MKTKLSTILLAAGSSSRMGRPKALLEYEGETFLDRQIRLYAGLGARVICVLGQDAGQVAAALQRAAEAVLVLNPAPGGGQLTSLQCGLRAMQADTEAFFFTPTDSPGVLAATVAALLEVWDGETDFVQPVYEGRHGHPVLASARMAPALLALPPQASARDLVRRSRRRFVEVSDPFVLLDVDTPEIYSRLLEGRFP
ncbi:MAG: nucleotidyltransferase family protein [Bryobacteraceae bacterium]